MRRTRWLSFAAAFTVAIAGSVGSFGSGFGSGPVSIGAGEANAATVQAVGVSAAAVPANLAGPAVMPAAVTAPVLRVMPGDRTVTVAWEAVSGATSYQVRYSTDSKLSGASSKATRGSSLALGSLRNGTTYYVQVVARVAGKSAPSKIASAKPVAGYPSQLKVTATSAGPDQVRVSWTGQTRATKVAVIAGSEGSLTEHAFNSAFYPATTISIVLTVPESQRRYLGTGSGNPIFIKVATYNNASAGNSLPRSANSSAGYRLSPAGLYRNAGVSDPEVATVRVATWNVQSVAATSGMKGYTWKDRRAKVAAGIAASGAALVSTIELTTGYTVDGVAQWEDLARLLQPKGYEIANEPTAVRAGSTSGAHLFYQPSVLTRLDGGEFSPKSLGIAWPSYLVNRYGTWAKFQVKATGQIFVAAAVHLPSNEQGHDTSAVRVTEAKAIDTMLSKMAGQNTVIMMGDFNSTFLANKNDPPVELHARGYYDASATANRSNPRIATANITNQIDNKSVKGYPRTPYVYQYAAPRIDYIMAKNSAGSAKYVNQVILKNGKFDPRYQGSDHNLQWAEIALHTPASGWLRCTGSC